MITAKKFLLFTVILIVAILYLQRWAYLTLYDKQYMQDYYEHSQWNIPDSVRVMGDDGRYEVAGYSIFHGGKLFGIAAEVPPLGKYLLGLSIEYFHNAKIIIIGIYLVACILFYALTKYFFTHQKHRCIALLLFILAPIIIKQLALSMLDLPQLTMLLAHVLCIFKCIETQNSKKEWLYVTLAGAMLGAFVSIKFGLFFVPIIITDSVILWKNKKLRALVPILLISPLIYILTYIKYFSGEGTVTTFIQAQKWLLNFYRDSNTGFIPGMALITLATGIYKGWWNQGWGQTNDWSLIMPLGALSIYATRKIRHGNYWNYVTLYTLLTTALLCIIAFWPRYLILVTPFLILYTVKVYEEKKIPKPIPALLIILILLQSIQSLFPQPTELLAGLKENMQKGTYKEVYEVVDDHTKQYISREDFWRNYLMLDTKSALIQKQVTHTTSFTYPWTQKVIATQKIHYQTEMGNFTYKKNITLTKKDNKWHVQWNWDNAFPEYAYKDHIVTTQIPSQKGKVLSPQGKILSQEGEAAYLLITPEKIDTKNEDDIVKKSSEFTGIQKFKIISRYLGNHPPDWPAPIGQIRQGIDPSLQAQLAQTPGVTMQTRSGRVYAKDLSSEQGEKVMTEEKKQWQKLNGTNGGEIQIVKNNGEEKTVFKSQPVAGQDIYIELP